MRESASILATLEMDLDKDLLLLLPAKLSCWLQIDFHTYDSDDNGAGWCWSIAVMMCSMSLFVPSTVLRDRFYLCCID